MSTPSNAVSTDPDLQDLLVDPGDLEERKAATRRIQDQLNKFEDMIKKAQELNPSTNFQQYTEFVSRARSQIAKKKRLLNPVADAFNLAPQGDKIRKTHNHVTRMTREFIAFSLRTLNQIEEDVARTSNRFSIEHQSSMSSRLSNSSTVQGVENFGGDSESIRSVERPPPALGTHILSAQQMQEIDSLQANVSQASNPGLSMRPRLRPAPADYQRTRGPVLLHPGPATVSGTSAGPTHSVYPVSTTGHSSSQHHRTVPSQGSTASAYTDHSYKSGGSGGSSDDPRVGSVISHATFGGPRPRTPPGHARGPSYGSGYSNTPASHSRYPGHPGVSSDRAPQAMHAHTSSQASDVHVTPQGSSFGTGSYVANPYPAPGTGPYSMHPPMQYTNTGHLPAQGQFYPAGGYSVAGPSSQSVPGPSGFSDAHPSGSANYGAYPQHHSHPEWLDSSRRRSDDEAEPRRDTYWK